MFKKSTWPKKHQWAQFFKVLSKKEKIFFSIFFLLFLVTSVYLIYGFYIKHTKEVPARGGTLIEGVVGQPRYINPVYANSDADRDLVQLIFSGLMKYDENMNIVNDLAEKYEIEEEGKIYKFYLKKDLVWQDNKPITADDVVFTIETIQNPDLKSPIQANWVGVEIEKIDDYGIKFTLKKPYAAFLENCTLGIIPKHIAPESSVLEPFELKTIGSGPYKIKKIKQEKTKIDYIILERNNYYYNSKPYISEIKFIFFENDEELAKAAKKNTVSSFSSNSYIELKNNWQDYTIALPRYFAVFFNQEKLEILKDINIRMALNYATNKTEINEQIVDSPILPNLYGFESPEQIYEFNLDKAKELLDKAGFKETESEYREKTINKNLAFTFKTRLAKGSSGTEVTELQKCLAKFNDIYPDGSVSGYFGAKTEEAVIKFQEKYSSEILEPYGYTEGTGSTGPSTQEKLNEICFETEGAEITPLKIILTTVNQPQMIKTAEILKEQWKQAGIELEIQSYPAFQLEQNIIKPREYQMLLFGEVLRAVPDPFSFWHSSQKNDPGLNLALYENKEVDELLEESRKSPDFETRTEDLNSFQNILIKDVPCIFLYSPDYIYLVSENIKGINLTKIVDPSKRFSGIENWYTKTKRTWK
jgi:ABC-type transport system substrate-binding protein